ncbi:ribonuclease H [Methylobacterium sp. WL9]|uniref:ribonuclease H family protein n=1 Tax=Methylobacterium sp. WL9 TaxID=2603898 RepID=UPI001AED1B90|nr:ribonuclease H [Methylobacterium sp. WL9]
MTIEPTPEFAIGLYGICKGNPGPGAYKAVIQHTQTGAERSVEGRAASTTANRMELTAAIEALKALSPGAVVIVLTNSEYVMKGMTEWLPGWRAKGWRGSNKKPVVNADLWGALDAAAAAHERVRWVVGKRA